MARPKKVGLDYFPLDVFLGGSVEYISCLYGAIGVQVIISLWRRIYAHSYYYRYDERAAIVCAKEFGEQLSLCFPKKNKESWEIFDEIVKKAVEFGVFDREMFEKHSILTSKSIQKTYLEAKRKSSAAKIDPRFALIDESCAVSAEETAVFGAETTAKTEIMPQSKVKQSKVKQSKVKQSKEKQSKEEESKEEQSKEEESKEKESKEKQAESGFAPLLSEVEDQELKKLYEEYLKMRELIRAPMTECAVESLIRRVNDLEPNNVGRQKKLLETAILNGWKNVYPVRDERAPSNANGRQSAFSHSYTDTNAIDYAALEEQILDQVEEDAKKSGAIYL